MPCHSFWSIGWAQILVIVLAITGAVCTAIWAYFFVHDDVRNCDGTRLSAQDKWHHILALLAFFILGAVVCGGGAIVAFRILDAF